MIRLSDAEIEKIVNLLKEGKPLPEDYITLLFETKKEYELVYDSKEREEDILADAMAVPLQAVKTFRNGQQNDEWTNMLIFGDNLQVLKTLLQMKQEGKLKNADGTPGVRLIYIDPPFATKQEFRGSQDQKAYQDKIAGAGFLEFLRKRLIFLRELLSDDGSIYVHLDWKKGHYVKATMDEVLGEYNFRNDIIWHYRTGNIAEKQFQRKHDIILLYSKSEAPLFNAQEIKEYYFCIYGPDFKAGFEGRKAGKDKYGEYRISFIDDVWDISAVFTLSGEHTDFPTQKPESLLDRVIRASSNMGDVIMDCFAGSGTTLAVAEKLGRRWIGVDCGKLAVYTMQKRLLNIDASKNLANPKRKYGKQCKPFTLFNAGLYDYKMIKELPWDQYRDFALKLFQCRDEKHEIARIEMDGYLGVDSVMVFNYQKHPNAIMDRGFIDDLHKYLSNKIGRRFFIIAPAASVQFLEDYIEKGKIKYYVLRIPYSIIEEIHKRGFTKIKQPVSELDVNDTIDAVGFDFIQIPTVECKYFIDKPKKKDLFSEKTKECVIKIEKFVSTVISRKPMKFENLETLSMVMTDYDFDGEVFDLEETFYAEELKKNDYEVRFSQGKIKEQMMIIYIDIFGNEKREIKTLKDFKQTKN